jgi:hypothetical protein
MFPIIVVLEAITEAELAAGGSSGAAPLPSSSVNTQVTYATLQHRSHHDSADSANSSGGGGGDGVPPGCHVSREWVVRPLKQKITVGGQTYELRELYGMEGGAKGAAASAAASNGGGGGGGGAGAGGPAAPGSGSGSGGGGASASAAALSAQEDSLASGSECVICLCERRDTAVLPCRHMCLCDGCAQQLRFNTNKCPVCRARE